MRDKITGARKRAVTMSIGSMLAVALCAAALPARAQFEISGNIGVVSDYVLRGITAATESDGPAVQGGFDLDTDIGLYAGYWASSLGYGSDNLTTTVENDFYAGYAGEVGMFSYDVGLTYYWYMDDSDSSGFEPFISLGVGPVALTTHYLAQDVSWGNQGDIYWTLGADFDLPYGFNLGLLAGYYTYKDSGDYIASTPESSAFRHLNISLSQQIVGTPVTMFATYVVGGDDRNGISQEDKIAIGFSYAFGATSPTHIHTR